MNRIFESVPQPIFSRKVSAPNNTTKPTRMLIRPGRISVSCDKATSSTAQGVVPRCERIINAMENPKRANPIWITIKSRIKVFQRTGFSIYSPYIALSGATCVAVSKDEAQFYIQLALRLRHLQIGGSAQHET